MKAIVLILAAALPCYAAPTDAPVVVNLSPPVKVLPRGSRVVATGDVMTEPMVCLTVHDAVASGKEKAACEEERSQLRADVSGGASPLVVGIVAGVLALGAGVAAGYGISQATAAK